MKIEGGSSPHAWPTKALRLGVSSCLLGREVRFDGQHKRDAFLVEVLAPFVTFVAVCPEVEVGMGVPRETLRLVRAKREGEGPILLAQKSGEDWTARMRTWASKRAAALDEEELVGYVLKSRSPSCGMERVKLYETEIAGARAANQGVGLFAAALKERFPNLPVEEEGRLNDPALRESFIERVFAYARLQALWATRWKAAELIAFHTAHKMSLLAHDPEGYRALGRLVAQVKEHDRAAFQVAYETAFMQTLARPATKARHTNALQHMMGHLRGHLDVRDRDELAGLIEDYRLGLLPLVVPVTLLAHHVRRCAVAYLAGQTYLEPHPKELLLRNHV